jgi:sugar fermentation stimulation protein A
LQSSNYLITGLNHARFHLLKTLVIRLARRYGFHAMKLFDDLEKAVFLDRPNRFVVRCRLGGRIAVAHMPNPGRMWELLLPGATLLVVRRSPGGYHRTDCTVVGVEKAGQPVMLHTQRTNDVARYLIKQKRISSWENFTVAQQEYTIGRSRFDLLLEGTQGRMVVEVKSCTLFGHGMAMFPDAVTERGRRHLAHLAELARHGLQTGVLFLVHYPHVGYFLPDYHTDFAFSRTFLEVRDCVMIKAVAVGWDAGLCLREELVHELTVPFDLLEREAVDAGVYIIIMRLEKGRNIAVGSLGAVHFKRGYYLYVGSARKNLQARMDRHRRQGKKLFWHIDHLRAETSFCAAVPVRGTVVAECELAAAVAAVSSWQTPGFGCSDCACASHLFGMAGDPLKNPAFIDLLLRMRIGALGSQLPGCDAHGKHT